MDSRVDPELRDALATMPQEDFSREGLIEIRAAMAQMPGQMQDVKACASVSNRMVAGPEGGPDVRLRIYEPLMKTMDHPGVLYIHGGGYILGTPEMTDASCKLMASETDCVVVSVDYRLAPEHPYPAALEDCYAALKWFSDHAAELGVDAGRIAVVGGSAGGGVTAALSLLARDRKGPAIVFQAPLYPMIDDRNITPSSCEFTDPRVWSRAKNLFAWEMYLGQLYGGDVSYYAAPARATDLTGLPPTYTCVGELDLFRDETINYAAKLLQAGVPTELHIYPGCFHAFDMFTGLAEISRRAEKELMTVLKNALKK